MSTICVVARAPLLGVAKPKIAEWLGPEFAVKLHGAMLRDTLDGLNAIEAARYVTTYLAEDGALGALAHHVHPPWELMAQPGRDLASAMHHAVEAFGTGALLLVRSDSPAALTEPIEEALREVERGDTDVVLAPTEDGGWHFIAMKEPARKLFEDIPWNTDAVADRTRAICQELSLRVRELPPTYDVDSQQDMEKLVAELKAHPERAPRTAEFLVRNGW